MKVASFFSSGLLSSTLASGGLLNWDSTPRKELWRTNQPGLLTDSNETVSTSGACAPAGVRSATHRSTEPSMRRSRTLRMGVTSEGPIGPAPFPRTAFRLRRYWIQSISAYSHNASNSILPTSEHIFNRHWIDIEWAP